MEKRIKIMVTIYVNLFFYGVGLIVEFKLRTQRTGWPSIIRKFIPLFGILVVVLITIILHLLLGFVTFIMWALFTMKAIINLFEEILHRCLNRVETSSSGIQKNNSFRLGANDNSPKIQENYSHEIQKWHVYIQGA